MVTESRAQKRHAVSNESGRLCEGVALEQVTATTLSGAPVIGSPDAIGFLDVKLPSRTPMLHGHEVSLRAGAGMVVDFIVGKEPNETHAKTRSMPRGQGAAA
jgi:anthranilate synthase component 1